MKFESELKKGIFLVGNCPKCNKISWPPSEYCNVCFGKLEWNKSSREGKLIEFTKKNDENFCVAEFEPGVRIMGVLKIDSKKPEIGSQIQLVECTIKNGNYSFIMRLC